MQIELIAEREDITPERAEKTQGLAPGFAKAVAEVRRNSKGLWGWCSVKLTVTFKEGRKKLVGTAYLGQCSYKDEADFIANSGYFMDMVKEAIADAR